MTFSNILQKIIANKREEVAYLKHKVPIEYLKKRLIPSSRDFDAALKQAGINIIAEIKKASPSEGVIRENFDSGQVFEIYRKYAAAVSILTDEKFFQGSLEILQNISRISELPLLRKDFIIDEYQVYETRFYGADAILLIAAILTNEQINHFLSLAESCRMEALVEIHNEEECERVLQTKARIIGINNRNLKDFSIDLDTSSVLASRIPNSKTVVIESGINNKSDIQKFSGICRNFLIGTALTRAVDIERQLREIGGG